MVKAIAPKTPSGATHMIMPMTPNSAAPASSSIRRKVWPRSPSLPSARPNRTANNSTGRMSPLAKAPTTESGMMASRKSMTDWCAEGLVYCATEWASNVAGLTFMPTPGWITKPTNSPISIASVVSTSK